MSQRPINALIAIGLALLPLPAMKLLDHFNRGCGDGLCGFWSGLLILGGLVGLTLHFLFRSVRQGESRAVLRLVPFVLWAVALVSLVV